eukprot:3840061-Amphidinium_carterae.1
MVSPCKSIPGWALTTPIIAEYNRPLQGSWVTETEPSGITGQQVAPHPLKTPKGIKPAGADWENIMADVHYADVLG